MSQIIYFGVLYPAVYARDRRLGRNVAYSLVPPDPWLVALGMIMWQGILEGLSWDVIKFSVLSAFQTMVGRGVAPTPDVEQVSRKTKSDLGFAWTSYASGRKQYEMFLGLRRTHMQEVEKKPAKKAVKKRLTKRYRQPR